MRACSCITVLERTVVRRIVVLTVVRIVDIVLGIALSPSSVSVTDHRASARWGGCCSYSSWTMEEWTLTIIETIPIRYVLLFGPVSSPSPHPCCRSPPFQRRICHGLSKFFANIWSQHQDRLYMFLIKVLLPL